MAEDDAFRKVFSHTLAEIEISNLAIPIQKSDFEKLRKAHDSIHEFSYIAPHLVNSDEEFDAKSAFLRYHHNNVIEQAHRSFLEALSGCYNAANILLRSTFELLIKGAFWECIAHKKYRKTAEVVKKTGKKNENTIVTLIDWLNDRFSQDPSIEDELENLSAGILDRILPLFDDEKLRMRHIPLVRTIIKQLADWNLFNPIQEPIDTVNYVYDVYKKLSADVHVEPDKTNIGRRLLAGKELFETEVIPEELDKYLGTLLKVMDLGIVIELNILEDLIIEKEESKKWLRERLFYIHELELNFASTKIVEMIDGMG